MLIDNTSVKCSKFREATPLFITTNELKWQLNLNLLVLWGHILMGPLYGFEGPAYLQTPTPPPPPSWVRGSSKSPRAGLYVHFVAAKLTRRINYFLLDDISSYVSWIKTEWQITSNTGNCRKLSLMSRPDVTVWLHQIPCKLPMYWTPELHHDIVS